MSGMYGGYVHGEDDQPRDPTPPAPEPLRSHKGFCHYVVQGTDRIGAPCPFCGHGQLAHPGAGNPGAVMENGCLVCELEILRDQLKGVLDEQGSG